MNIVHERLDGDLLKFVDHFFVNDEHAFSQDAVFLVGTKFFPKGAFGHVDRIAKQRHQIVQVDRLRLDKQTDAAFDALTGFKDAVFD